MNMHEQLSTNIEGWQNRIEAALEKWLPKSTIQPERLHDAMRYSSLSAGKRIRPVLVYATGKALGINADILDIPAVAVELIHAYSLVHDDLPAMDNDDLRRGRPTCHKAYDDGTAVLVGDALQSLAFYVLSHGNKSLPAEQRLSMIESLSLAAGSRGMAGGQAIDIASVNKELNQAELDNMHIHKTGALLRASVRLGMWCCEDIDDSVRLGLDHYAKCVGLAFQIQDDILDVEGETSEIGKPKGSDQALNKPTYPSVIGLSEAKEAAEELFNSAITSIEMLDERGDSLRQLADFIVHRSR